MRNGFVGHVLKLVTGAVVAQAITLITAPILSRLFPPEAFGTCSVFVAIISLLPIIVCLNYEYAIMLPERDEDAINLVMGSLVIAFVFSGGMGFLIWIEQEFILKVLKSPELGPYLWIVPGALFIQGLFQSLNSWNSRRKYACVCSCPILLCVEEARNVLNRAEGGLFVPPEDADAMAKALLNLKQNPQLRKTMGRNGRTFTERHYSRPAQATQLAHLLEHIILDRS